MMAGFIAVHVGAGFHDKHLRTDYKKTCAKACSKAISMLEEDVDAVEAVAKAVSVLEDCPLTNAGIGSNLTLNGTIECDAGIMDGASLNFGSVGALCNVQNPIQVAKELLVEQKKGLLCGNLIPPCTLVREGALDWALNHGFHYLDNINFITERTRNSYMKNKILLNRSASSVSQTSYSTNIGKPKNSKNDLLFDTVGAICVDSMGNVASAASSGGVLLKHPGRIGQASIYGAGFWAENSKDKYKPSVACTVSGNGEYLIKTMFAKECSTRLQEKHECVLALQDVFKEKYLNSIFLKSIDSKQAGVLALKHYADNSCKLDWAHNTQTMILGWGSSKIQEPVCLVSEQPKNTSCTNESIIGGRELIKL